MRIMKEGLENAGIKKHLMIQPLGYLTPDIDRSGFTGLVEFPYGIITIYLPINLLHYSSKCAFFSALEPRSLTRFDVHKYAREAYDLGIRYIGGCCGFEAYHIRAISQEVHSYIFM